MSFEKVISEGLAHYSYIAGDSGEAFVIDPRRDVNHILKSQKAIAAGYCLFSRHTAIKIILSARWNLRKRQVAIATALILVMESRLTEIPSDRTVVSVCSTGNRAGCKHIEAEGI